MSTKRTLKDLVKYQDWAKIKDLVGSGKLPKDSLGFLISRVLDEGYADNVQTILRLIDGLPNGMADGVADFHIQNCFENTRFDDAFKMLDLGAKASQEMLNRLFQCMIRNKDYRIKKLLDFGLQVSEESESVRGIEKCPRNRKVSEESESVWNEILQSLIPETTEHDDDDYGNYDLDKMNEIAVDMDIELSNQSRGKVESALIIAIRKRYINRAENLKIFCAQRTREVTEALNNACLMEIEEEYGSEAVAWRNLGAELTQPIQDALDGALIKAATTFKYYNVTEWIKAGARFTPTMQDLFNNALQHAVDKEDYYAAKTWLDAGAKVAKETMDLALNRAVKKCDHKGAAMWIKAGARVTDETKDLIQKALPESVNRFDFNGAVYWTEAGAHVTAEARKLINRAFMYKVINYESNYAQAWKRLLSDRLSPEAQNVLDKTCMDADYPNTWKMLGAKLPPEKVPDELLAIRIGNHCVASVKWYVPLTPETLTELNELLQMEIRNKELDGVERIIAFGNLSTPVTTAPATQEMLNEWLRAVIYRRSYISAKKLIKIGARVTPAAQDVLDHEIRTLLDAGKGSSKEAECLKELGVRTTD